MFDVFSNITKIAVMFHSLDNIDAICREKQCISPIIDGLDQLNNVLVIGTTNQNDLWSLKDYFMPVVWRY